MPTYFSLFGIINILKSGPLPNLYFPEFGNQIREITNGASKTDNHVFEGRTNFCVLNGKLKIADYGNPKTQKVLDNFATDIYDRYIV